jgi:flagellar hook-associated protein 3 FlgL
LAAPVAAQPARTKPLKIVLLGDSLAHEVNGVVRFLSAPKPVIPKFWGGTAPCDWLGVDLQANRSTVVVVSFTGNSLTPCMSDGAGGYLFAGTTPSAPPFTQSGNTVGYVGDQTAQRLEIAQGRLQQVKFPGDAVFNRMRAGNGEFTTAVGATNSGGAWIDAGSVIDPSATQERPYSINFVVDALGPRYSVVRTNADATTTVVASGNYASPAAIQFDGVRVNINGAPANGDTFALQPAASQSLFDSLAQAINALRQPAAVDGLSRAQLRTALAGTQASMAGALDHVLIKQAEMGAGLQELQAYADLNADRSIEYQARLSSVEDLDYAQATAELARQQVGYQAALQSYSKVSKLSLFDFL